MSSDETTVILKFVAQSGYVWEKAIDVDDIEATVETIVEEHGDIDRVERLASPDDLSGEVIWRFE